MLRPAVLFLPLLTSGCLTIPGTQEGGPCNQQRQCLEPLVCDEQNTCVSAEKVAWEKMNPPDPVDLNAVWGFGENDLFAVGASGTVLRYQGNGVDWSKDTAPGTLGVSLGSLVTAWGRGGELWAGGSTVIHYQSGKWTAQRLMDPTASAPFTNGSVRAITGLQQGGTVWAVGNGTPKGTSTSKNYVFKLQGTDWYPDSSVTLDFDATAIGAAGSRVFVVGSAQHVWILDGSWTSKNLTSQLGLKGVWGATVDDVWAVGPSKTLLRNWAMDAGASDLPAVNAIMGTAGGDFYLASSSDYYSNRSDVYHCTPACQATPTTTDNSSQTFHGIWCSDDGSVVVVVGDDGMIYRRIRK
jgi:hypothetical protein